MMERGRGIVGLDRDISLDIDIHLIQIITQEPRRLALNLSIV